MDSTSDDGSEGDSVGGGSSSESTGNSGWSDESSSTLWGWLSSIADGLKTVWQSVTNLPSLIWSAFKDAFDTVTDWLYDIVVAIFELPGKVLEGIKEIFIPDTEEIESMFDEASNSIRSKFGFQEFNLDSLANNSSQPTDIEGNYSINGLGTMKLTFFDTTYLIKGVEYFRPFIRGFIVLLLVLFNTRMFLVFIGQDVGGSGSSSTELATTNNNGVSRRY